MKLDNDLYMAHNWLGLCYYHIGKDDESVAEYSKLLNISCEPSIVSYHRAIAYKAKRRYDKAIEAFKRLIDENPNHVAAHYHLGLSYMGNHEMFKALQTFRKVLKLNPNHKKAQMKVELLANVPDI